MVVVTVMVVVTMMLAETRPVGVFAQMIDNSQVGGRPWFHYDHRTWHHAVVTASDCVGALLDERRGKVGLCDMQNDWTSQLRRLLELIEFVGVRDIPATILQVSSRLAKEPEL